MNEDITEEIIESITPTPLQAETENLTVQPLTIESYDLGQYAVIGLGAGGACVVFSLGVATVLKILKSSM